MYIRKYPDLWNEVITVKKDFIFLFFFPLSILLFLSTFTFFKRFFWGPQLNLIIWKSEWVTVLILRNIINSQYYDKLQFLSFLFFNLNKLIKSINISFPQIFTITKNSTQDDHRPRCFSKAAQKYKWHSIWTSRQGKVEIKFDKRCWGTTLWYSHTKTACGLIVHSDTKRKMFADIAFDNVSFGRFSQSSQKHQGNYREKERVRKQRRRTSL